MALWPLAVYFGGVLALVAAMLLLSWVLGERHRERATGAPYEGGILSAGSARVRFPAQFYLLAMFFVVFDLEAVFILAWAVGGRELGWSGYTTMVVFASVLMASLAYLSGVGALDFGRPAQPRGKKKTARELPRKGGETEITRAS
jgi:NADH-quinone oxidoreductase subunit A